MRPDEVQWLSKQWNLCRAASLKAERYSAEWNERNDTFTTWITDQPGIDHTDPAAVARIKNENLGLKDAFAAWDFWRRESDRLANMIQAFRAVKELEEF